jgi:TPR repeat protein
MAQLPHDLSPLEMLEQRSRRLATRLHDPPRPRAAAEPPKPADNSAAAANDDIPDHHNYEDDEPARGLSRSSRTNSTASLTSLGSSILGNFRLSTFSILNNSNNYSSSSLVDSTGSDRTSIYEHQPRPPQQQGVSASQQQRMTHYRSDSTATLTPLAPSASRDRYSRITSSSSPSPAAEQRRSTSYSRLSSSTGTAASPGITSSISPQHSGSGISSSHGRQPSTSTISSQSLPALSPVTSAASEMGAAARRSLSHENQYVRSVPGSSTTESKPSPSQPSSESEFEVLRMKSLNNSLTLEEHVSLGIYYHESGNLREASYHWQNASFHGDTTGMLLYGLALRHGWGIKQNPVEAFKWLRKAIGPAIEKESLETALKNDLGQALQDKLLAKDPAAMGSRGAPGQNKFKKARIAAAMYELGMCYLNSWGTEKDEEMALHCFELAGNMGDCDALCEAASMWMKNGPKGRKKDLQRAAKLYRTAGEKGANMVSNSWIYKDKYMGDDAKDKKKKR